MTNLIAMGAKVKDAKGVDLRAMAEELGMVGVSRAKVEDLRAMVLEEITNQLRQAQKDIITDAANAAKVGAPLPTNDGTEESDESSEEEDDDFQDAKSASDKAAESQAAKEAEASDKAAAEAINTKSSKKAEDKAKKSEAAEAKKAADASAIEGIETVLASHAAEDMSQAAKIRLLLKEGFERKHIAKALDTRYQQVFQVEKQMIEREAKEAAKAEGAE